MIGYYLENIIFFLYSLLFTITPIVVLPFTSELFEFNKIIFIYLITALISLFWLAKIILFKKIILKKTPFDIFFLLFFLSQLLSTYFSIDRHTSFFGFYGRFNGGLLSLIVYLILYYGFTSNLGKSQIIRILRFSILSSILVFLIGLPGKINHDLLCFIFTHEWSNGCWTEQFKPAERMFSTLGQPNWFGAYLSVNFFISLYFYFKKNPHTFSLKNLFDYLAPLFIFTGILFSRSRSAIIATIFLSILSIAVLMIIGYFRKNNHKPIKLVNLRKLAFFFFTLILPLIIFKTGIKPIDDSFNFLNLNTRNKAKINKVKPSQPQTKILVTESLDIRKIVWQGAIALGKRYPLLGTGVETFGYSYYFTRPKEHNLTSEWDYLYNRAHNEYLNFLATTGFFGLGTYLLMILTVFIIAIKYTIYYFREKNDDNFFLTFFLLLAYTSILITNFFGFSTTTISLFFYLIPAIIILIKRNKLAEENKKFTQITKESLFFFGLFFIFIAYIILKIINYWRADIHYAQAQKYSQLNYYEQAANQVNQALKLKYEHVYEDKLSIYLATLAFIAADQNQKETSQKLIAASKFFNDKAIGSSPKNILYLKTKAKNNYLYYQALLDKKFLDEGIMALILAYNYAPTEPKIPYNLAIFYNLLEEINQNKNEKKLLLNKALEYCNQAITLKSNYRDALFLKSQILLKIE